MLLPGRAQEDKPSSSINEASLLKSAINFDPEGIKPTYFYKNMLMARDYENAKKENMRGILAAAYEEYRKKRKSEPPWLRL